VGTNGQVKRESVYFATLRWTLSGLHPIVTEKRVTMTNPSFEVGA
jgi:hypothetical protein